MDEIQIRKIIELNTKLDNLKKAKDSAIKNIEEQGKLTENLKANILNATTLIEVEDIYAPFKRKKKTKADIAREKGFGVIANCIKNQFSISIPSNLLKDYSKEEIVEGAKDILIQVFADDTRIKDKIRKHYQRFGKIESKNVKLEKLNSKQMDQLHKFKIYNSFSSSVNRIKSYQVLALNRGESLRILKVKMEKSIDSLEYIEKILIRKSSNVEILKECVKNAYAKLFKSVTTEIRNDMTSKASVEAINNFQENLKKLLMLKPHYNKSLLAIDPGLRTGCKLCV